MTTEEKNAWAYLALAVVIPAVYVGWVIGQSGDTAIGDIAYVRPLLYAIGTAIVTSILAAIAVAIASPKRANKKDARDIDIERRGNVVGSFVFAIAALAPFGLAMADVDTFWIANAMYLSYVLSAIISTIARLLAYRKGL